MTRKTRTAPIPTVRGINAPTVRLTPLGAALIAAMVAIPAGLLIGLIDWLV